MSNVDSHALDPSPRFWRPVILLVFATLLLRGGVLLMWQPRLAADPDGYRQIALNVARYGVLGYAEQHGQVQPTAFRPPLYPLLLSALSRDGQIPPLHIGFLHLVLAVLSVAAVYQLARWWGLGRWSWAAPLLLAADPILVNQSVLVMTETLATCLALGALLALTLFSRTGRWSHVALAGAAVGLAALCRPTFLVWLGLIFLVLLAQAERTAWKTRLVSVGLLVLAAAVVLAPWAIRNWVQIGEPIATTTHGGYTILLGNNPPYYDYLREHAVTTVWDARHLQEWLSRQSPPPMETEKQHDRWHQQLAWQIIREQPGMFLRASGLRVAQFWSPIPNAVAVDAGRAARVLRSATLAWYLACYLLALLGGWRLGKQLIQPPWVWGLTLAFGFTAVHAIYWSNLRMRAPVMPLVYLLAAVGLGWGWETWQKRRLRAKHTASAG